MDCNNENNNLLYDFNYNGKINNNTKLEKVNIEFEKIYENQSDDHLDYELNAIFSKHTNNSGKKIKSIIYNKQNLLENKMLKKTYENEYKLLKKSEKERINYFNSKNYYTNDTKSKECKSDFYCGYIDSFEEMSHLNHLRYNKNDQTKIKLSEIDLKGIFCPNCFTIHSDYFYKRDFLEKKFIFHFYNNDLNENINEDNNFNEMNNNLNTSQKQTEPIDIDMNNDIKKLQNLNQFLNKNLFTHHPKNVSIHELTNIKCCECQLIVGSYNEEFSIFVFNILF